MHDLDLVEARKACGFVGLLSLQVRETSRNGDDGVGDRIVVALRLSELFQILQEVAGKVNWAV